MKPARTIEDLDAANARIRELEKTNAELRNGLESNDCEIAVDEEGFNWVRNKLQQRLERVYDERNALVISLARLALAAGYKAGWGTDSNEENDPEWRTVVYVQFDGVPYRDRKVGFMGCIPDFQLSWHMAPDWQTAAQANLPEFSGQRDGTFLGRDPANYVGQVPIQSALANDFDKKYPVVTLDCDQMSAAQVVTLAAEFEASPAGKLQVGEMKQAMATPNPDGTYSVRVGDLCFPRCELTPAADVKIHKEGEYCGGLYPFGKPGDSDD